MSYSIPALCSTLQVFLVDYNQSAITVTDSFRFS